jgi:hypothetical protein
MARQVQEETEEKRAVPARDPQDSSSDDEIAAADKALAAMGYAPVSIDFCMMDAILHGSTSNNRLTTYTDSITNQSLPQCTGFQARVLHVVML